MNLRPVFDPKLLANQSNYYYFDDIFSADELNKIDSLQNEYEFNSAIVVGDNENLNQIRKSQVKWIPFNDSSKWLYDKIETMINEANQVFQFHISSVIDNIQYTEYKGGGGHYGWHMDIGPYPINHRKISITIQLSDPDEYVGGELELWTGQGQIRAPRSKGCAILFPSYIMHRVTPVQSGTRKSIVLWVGGESFR